MNVCAIPLHLATPHMAGLAAFVQKPFAPEEVCAPLRAISQSGGAYGARTRNLRRDRAAL